VHLAVEGMSCALKGIKEDGPQRFRSFNLADPRLSETHALAELSRCHAECFPDGSNPASCWHLTQLDTSKPLIQMPSHSALD